MSLFCCKANVKSFGFNKLHLDFDMRIVHTVMDGCGDNGRKENVHDEKFINVHLAFLILKY